MAGNSVPAARIRRGRPGAQDTDRHVGAMLRARRIALGLTQQQLAERVGITYQQAHKYETGINRISAGRLYTLARALEVEPAYFFQGLGTAELARPQPRQRQLLELTRSFVTLPRRQQEALAELARALAGAEVAAA
jgi:transcriptional regulator with XRE-family HTH domain